MRVEKERFASPLVEEQSGFLGEKGPKPWLGTEKSFKTRDTVTDSAAGGVNSAGAWDGEGRPEDSTPLCQSPVALEQTDMIKSDIGELRDWV